MYIKRLFSWNPSPPRSSSLLHQHFLLPPIRTRGRSLRPRLVCRNIVFKNMDGKDRDFSYLRWMNTCINLGNLDFSINLLFFAAHRMTSLPGPRGACPSLRSPGIALCTCLLLARSSLTFLPQDGAEGDDGSATTLGVTAKATESQRP